MDQNPTCNAAVSSDAQPVVDSVYAGPNPHWRFGPVVTAKTDDAATHGNAIKIALINLIPPAMIVVVVLFWALGPKAWIKNDWSILIAGGLTAAFVLSLEAVLERHAGWRLNKREFVTDFFYLILGYTAISWVSNKLAEEPLKAVKTSLGITTEWASQLPFLVQVVLMIFLIEFGQYWMHRLMHNWHPLWLTHAPHHHITQLNAMKGAVGNPLELFLISLSVLALFDFQQAAMFCAFNVLGVVSTFAHANVRSDPPAFYSFFFTTIRHHSLHHSVGYEDTRCNYANSLILIDRVCGTYREGESAIVGQDERKRLSIWEQFMFPWLGWIDKIRASRIKSISAAG